MPFTTTVIFSFGVSHAALGDIRVQPRKADGTATGPLLAPAMLNEGKGLYTATLSVPDDAVTVRAYSLATPTLFSVRPVKPPATAAVVPPGADPLTWTITTGTGPVADADVWVTRTASPTDQVVASGRTDTTGTVVFLVDGFVAGTQAKRPYYGWMQKDGVNPLLAVVLYCD